MFEFIYKGESIQFEGYNESDAMRDANNMFNQKEEGMWRNSKFEPEKFTWVEGNFFD